MTELRSETEKEALKDWFKPLLDKVVQEMLKRKAVVGTAVEASPAWAFPNKILIAKVWGMGQKNRFIWTISGEGVITDYIAGNIAATPRDAARHFALKWQMDADRLLAAGQSKGPTQDAQLQMGSYVSKLTKDAESLYDLTDKDEIWL